MKLLMMLFFLSITTWAMTFEDAVMKAEKENKKILVEMVMEFCPFCEQVDKYILSRSEVQMVLNNHFIFVKLDINKDEIPEHLTSRMTPTFYFLNTKGENILHEMKGAPSKSEFLNQLQYVITLEN